MMYGMPYQGSKNSIAQWVVSQMPQAEVFYDLFCGGCAITHAAMLCGKYKKVVFNDVISDVPQLFMDAISGRFENETRFITREEFFEKKAQDAYIRILWSFGNKQDTYIYGRDVEPFKHAAHDVIVFDDYGRMADILPFICDDLHSALDGVEGMNRRRIIFMRTVKQFNLDGKIKDMLKISENLQRLNRLRSLRINDKSQQIQHLQSLQRLKGLAASQVGGGG